MSVPVRSATELAEKVRERSHVNGKRIHYVFEDEFAALVALAEQADDLLRQRTELQNSIGNNVVTVDTLVREKSEGWTRALSAEARVAELERERDFWEQKHKREHRTRHAMEDEIARLRARVDELETTLARLHNDLGGESMRCERAEGRVAELERQRNEARTQRARLYLIERERVAELETTLKRIIAQFETNSEAGAPQYLFDALAAGSPTGQEQQA